MEENLQGQKSYDDPSQSSENGMEIEIEQENSISVPWANLPSLAVENIYSFLSRVDQIRMSQVCRKWNQEYNSPSLWRSFKFYLPKRSYNTIEVHPDVTFARKFGHMFRDVQIITRNIRISLQGVIQTQLKLFLQALAFHSQLRSISFLNMFAYFKDLDDDGFEDVYQSIVDLLLTQNKLQSVKFNHAEFNLTEAAEIVKSIFLKNTSTLRRLELKGFIQIQPNDENPYEVIETSLSFDTLINLKSLTTDYTNYFEAIITSCYEYGSQTWPPGKKGDLETIKLTCFGTDDFTFSYQQIQPTVWKYMRKLFPALRINLSFKAKGRPIDDFDVFIVRHMPVKSLKLTFDANERPRRKIGEVLRHITTCKINECLEILSISGLTSPTNFAPDLLNFLQACPELKMLQLYVERPVESLHTVFQSWLESGRKSLETVHITIRNVRCNEAASNYASIEDYYAPILQVMGLNLILIVDTV